MPRQPSFGSIYRPVKTLADRSKMRTRVWWIRYYLDGKQVAESSRSRRYSDAAALLRQRVAEIETGAHIGPSSARTTVAELLDDLIRDFEINGKSVQWMRYVDGHLRPMFGRLPAASITTEHLHRYIAARRTDGVANSTINRELMRLKRAFNLGRAATPPKVKRVPTFPRLEEPPPRKGFFEHKEFLALRSELPERLRPVLTFGYYTGCRKGEILALKWSQVDLDVRIVRLEPGETKNDEARTIPLLRELSDMLTIEKQRRDQRWPSSPWVFARYGKRIKDFRGAWEEACKRCGLWNPEAERPARIFHDLRRTGARNLVRAGVPERVVMAIGGWKTRSVFDRYNIVSERDLYDAASRLERHIADIETSLYKATSRQLSARTQQSLS